MSRDELNPKQRRASYQSSGITAREEGTIIKEWGGRLPIALIYPNAYYIGMSNLGFQAIYQWLNGYGDVVCERVFWEQGNKLPLSLESAHPLTDFACLAFSFSYELDYLNLAPMLNAAGVPVYSKERDESYPLLIAGGPCITANPMPLAPFFDVMCIGEAEAILPELLPVLSEDLSREARLKKLAHLPGVYVPRYYDGRSISRQWVSNLNSFPVHSVVLTPNTELGDLYLIEVERGCSWNCSFCLVSRAFCPTRFRLLASLLRQAQEGFKYRPRMGLVGPVVTDHPQIEELLTGLLDMGTGFSLSSLRLKPLPSRLLELMIQGGARSLALAPEAGSEHLRRMIKKGFHESDILEAVTRVAAQPFKRLKLYFMLGLPTETDEDVEEIINLALQCQSILDRSQRGCRLSLNVAPFVPKAGTLFQRLGMADTTTLERRLARLKAGLRAKGISIKAESIEWSHVQGALSRGDIKIAGVLANIKRASLSEWRSAVKNAGLDIGHYVVDDWDTQEALPWGMIDLKAG